MSESVLSSKPQTILCQFCKRESTINMILWVILICSTILAIYLYLNRTYNYWRRLGIPQNDHTFKDNFGMLLKKFNFFQVMEDAYFKAGQNRFYGVYFFTQPSLMIKDLDLLKQITVKDFDHFQDHQKVMLEDAEPLWTKNLFSLKGQRWKEMRATLSPSFTSGKMRTMFGLIEECGRNFVQYFKNCKDEELNCLELKDVFSRFTNDVIASVAFGIKVDSMVEKNNEFFEMGKRMMSFTSAGFWNIIKILLIMTIPAIQKILPMEIFEKEVTTFFRRLIKETLTTREENNIIRPDMLHLLMEARKHGSKYEESKDEVDTGFATAKESEVGRSDKIMKYSLSDDDITAQALIFFLAGFDAVSSLMCFTAYELSLNPDIQNRLAAEIDETWENCNGKLTYEALLKMKYLDMVISETLRKWPPTRGVDRSVTKPYTIEPKKPGEKSLHLKKGTVIFIPIGCIHRDPEHYPNPDKYDPERFSDENKANIKPYSFIPFGHGPRNCIASRFALLEVKSLFFYLLREFEIKVNEKTDIPIEISPFFGNVDAKNGFWLSFKRRERRL